MSFLSGLLGDKAESYVDMAVDKAAEVAKEKVKEMLEGDDKEKEQGKEEEKGGGIISLAKDLKEAEKGGLSALVSGDGKEKSKSGGGFNLEEIAGDLEKEEKEFKDDPADAVLSMGKKLFM